MNSTQKVISNSLLTLLFDAIIKASRALVFVLVARHLGPTESGAFTVALSFQAIFQAFTLAGADYLLMREVAKDRGQAPDFFIHMAVLKIVLSCISLLVLVILLGTVFRYSVGTSRIILLLALTILPEGIGEVCRALFVTLSRLLFPAIVAAVSSSAKLLVVYIVLRQQMGVETVVLVVLATSVFSVVANLSYALTRLIRPTWTLQWRFFQTSIFPKLGAFAGISILRVLEYHITILILSSISGERQVGVYNAAYTIVLAILMTGQAYGSGAIPVFSRLYAESRHSEFRNLYRRSVQALWAAALLIVIIVVWFSPMLILGIYTFQYEETIDVLRILCLGIPFTLLFTPHACIMLAANMEESMVRILSISIIVNVLASLLLMPDYGAIGASIARVSATALTAALYYIVVRRKVVRIGLLQLVGIGTLAGGVMILVARMLLVVKPWVALLVSGAVYLTILIFAVMLSEEDRNLVLQVFGSSRSPQDN